VDLPDRRPVLRVLQDRLHGVLRRLPNALLRSVLRQSALRSGAVARLYVPRRDARGQKRELRWERVAPVVLMVLVDLTSCFLSP
jgi:hypothetical protein